MKLLLTALCLVALATFAYTYDTTWGRRNGSDYRIYIENVKRYPAKAAWDVRVNFPKSGYFNDKNITAIYIFDIFANKSGAVASLLSGGIGKKFAQISLRTQPNRGMDSTVEIYGK